MHAAARGRAISLWTAAASVALSAGPVLGGVLVDTLGWRSIFLLNVPIGVLGIWLTRLVVAETPASGGGFDPAGQILALLTLLGLTGGVIEGGRLGFASPLVLSGLGIAVLCAIGFVAVEARGREPMLPLGFFRDRTFSAATLVGLFINLTLYGALFVLGLYLQQVHGYSPMTAGLAFLPFPIALGIANVAAGPIGARLGLRLPMGVGLIVGGGGYWLLRHLDATTPYASMLPGLIVIPRRGPRGSPDDVGAALDRSALPLGHGLRRSQYGAAGRRRNRRGAVRCADGRARHSGRAERIPDLRRTAGLRCRDRRLRCATATAPIQLMRTRATAMPITVFIRYQGSSQWL
jgi:Major Facilitator Superfamily